MAARIAAEGFVTVSLRRSIMEFRRLKGLRCE